MTFVIITALVAVAASLAGYCIGALVAERRAGKQIERAYARLDAFQEEAWVAQARLSRERDEALDLLQAEHDCRNGNVDACEVLGKVGR